MKLASSIALASVLSLSTAKIQIFNPDSLRSEVADAGGLIEAGLANFGHIQYGTSFVSLQLGKLRFYFLLVAAWRSFYPKEES